MTKKLTPIVALLLALSCTGIAQVSPTTVHVEISFEFHVDKAVLPAGSYAFDVDKGDVVTIRNVKTGKSMVPHLLTRISQSSIAEPRVVFDKVGDQNYLAELHVPGIDGFHFDGTPGPHTHVSVHAKK